MRGILAHYAILQGNLFIYFLQQFTTALMWMAAILIFSFGQSAERNPAMCGQLQTKKLWWNYSCQLNQSWTLLLFWNRLPNKKTKQRSSLPRPWEQRECQTQWEFDSLTLQSVCYRHKGLWACVCKVTWTADKKIWRKLNNYTSQTAERREH